MMTDARRVRRVALSFVSIGTRGYTRLMAVPAKTYMDKPVRRFRDGKAWEAWLAKNHAASDGLWIEFGKRDSGIVSIWYPEALECALCYGWIDGQSKGNDELTYWQKFTPRGKRSIWSKINRAKVQALIESGRMRAAGLAEIERAKSDGRWDRAYDSPANAEVPEDLTAALKRNAKARRFFETLSGQNRYAILFRIQTAKKAETRARRIGDFVAMLARGETFH